MDTNTYNCYNNNNLNIEETSGKYYDTSDKTCYENVLPLDTNSQSFVYKNDTEQYFENNTDWSTVDCIDVNIKLEAFETVDNIDNQNYSSLQMQKNSKVFKSESSTSSLADNMIELAKENYYLFTDSYLAKINQSNLYMSFNDDVIIVYETPNMIYYEETSDSHKHNNNNNNKSTSCNFKNFVMDDFQCKQKNTNKSVKVERQKYSKNYIKKRQRNKEQINVSVNNDDGYMYSTLDVNYNKKKDQQVDDEKKCILPSFYSRFIRQQDSDDVFTRPNENFQNSQESMFLNKIEYENNTNKQTCSKNLFDLNNCFESKACQFDFKPNLTKSIELKTSKKQESKKNTTKKPTLTCTHAICNDYSNDYNDIQDPTKKKRGRPPKRIKRCRFLEQSNENVLNKHENYIRLPSISNNDVNFNNFKFNASKNNQSDESFNNMFELNNWFPQSTDTLPIKNNTFFCNANSNFQDKNLIFNNFETSFRPVQQSIPNIETIDPLADVVVRSYIQPCKGPIYNNHLYNQN